MLSATSTVFLDPYLVKLGSLDLVYSAYPRVLPPKKEPEGRAIWHAHQGPMLTRTGPKLTKAEKKAERKEKRAKALSTTTINRMNRA